MGMPFTQNAIRANDHAIYDWVGKLPVDYGTVEGKVQGEQPILRVVESPRRAFGIMQKILVQRGWLPSPVIATTALATTLIPGAVYQGDNSAKISYRSSSRDQLTHYFFLLTDTLPVDGDFALVSGGGPDPLTLVGVQPVADAELEELREFQYPNVPLPFASIGRGAETPDPGRAVSPQFYWALPRNSFPGDYAVNYYPHPRPVNISYSIEFWALRRSTEVWLKEWVLGQVNHSGAGSEEIMILVNFDPPWGTKIVPFQVDGFTDNSELEGLSGQNRLLRFTLSGTLKTWTPLPARKTVKPVFKISETYSQGEPTPYQDTADLETVSYDGNMIRHGALGELLVPNAANIVTVEKRALHPEDGISKPEFPTYGLKLTDADVPAQTKMLPLKVGVYVLRGDLYIRSDGEPLTVSIIARSGEILLEETFNWAGWGRIERYFVMPENVGFDPAGAVLKFQTADDSSVPCLLSSWSIRNVGQYFGEDNLWSGGDLSGTLANGQSTQSDVEFADDLTPHVIYGSVLSTGGPYRILFSSAASDPASQWTLPMGSAAFFAIPVIPQKGVTTGQITVINDGSDGSITLSDIVLKTCLVAPKGSRVPSDW